MHMKVFLCTSIRYCNDAGKWVLLPVPEKSLPSILDTLGQKLGLLEYLITNQETDHVVMRGVIHSYAEAARLNDLAESIHNIPEQDEDKFYAILECEDSLSIAEVKCFIERLDAFLLLCGIESDDALGRCFAQNDSITVSKKQLAELGKSIRGKYDCMYTTYGCLIKNFSEDSLLKL